jgi:hypothetical protein
VSRSHNLLQVQRVCSGLGDEEMRVVLGFARRIAAGQSQYGKLDLANDQRDWTEEAAQELLDGMAYVLMRLEGLRGGR